MMALINFVTASTFAELVLFADERLDASKRQIGLLFAAGSAGVVVTGLLAGRLRKRFSFTALAMTSLMLMGGCTVVFAGMRWFWAALPLWAAAGGLGILFNINTGSLRQAIVPNHLLSRVLSIAGVLAWSAIPAGALVGGWLISVDRQRRVRLRRDRDHHDLHRGVLPVLHGSRRRAALRRRAAGRRAAAFCGGRHGIGRAR